MWAALHCTTAQRICPSPTVWVTMHCTTAQRAHLPLADGCNRAVIN
jgi:hypothetical protein